MVVHDCAAIPGPGAVGVAVTLYDASGDPSVEVGACADTVIRRSPAAAATARGALGAPTGTTAAVGAEAADLRPEESTATTANRYDVPLVRPVTVQVVSRDPAGALARVRPPLWLVALRRVQWVAGTSRPP